MPTVINGVNTEELVGNFEEGIGPAGPFARKGFLCDWVNRYRVANGLLGFSTLSGGVGGTISITHPYVYPESANLYAREVAIEGVGQPTQGPKQIQFPYALVWVSYGVPQYGVLPSDDPSGANSLDPAMPLLYATQEIDYSTEWVTLPNTSVKLANGHTIKQDYGFQVARADMQVTLHKFPYMPGRTVLATLGAPLNNAKFLGGDPGKVRFGGARTQRTFSADGTFTQDITYTFSYRPIAPWDQIFDPDGTSGWQQVQDKSSNPVLGRSDLTVLFPAPYK